MVEEIKIYIDDYKAIEGKLESLGAKFIREVHVTDQYFNQPEGSVLKLVEDDRGSFLVKLQAHEGGFRIISQEPLQDLKIKRDALEKKYGIKCVLEKRRR